MHRPSHLRGRCDVQSGGRGLTARSLGNRLRAIALHFWQLLPRRRSLVDQYSAAAPRWHAAVQGLGYLRAYADLISAADARLRRAHRSHPTLPALDVGTGTGGFALSLVDWHRTTRSAPPLILELLDPSTEMLDVAVRNHREQGVEAEATCGDIASLRRSPQRYWLVMCSHALEHTRDAREALATLREVLSPGGMLLLVVSRPHWCTALLQFRWRNNSWSETEVRQLLAAANLSRVSSFRFRNGPPSRTSIGFIACRESA